MLNQILVVEDNDLERALYQRVLSEEGYDVSSAADIASALNFINNRMVHVVLLDIYLPDGRGIDLIVEIKRKFPEIEIVIYTGKGNIPDTVKAIKLGAFDYIIKGDSAMYLLQTVRKATDSAIKKFKERSSHEKIFYSGFDKIIGESEAIENAKNIARKVAITQSNVLLLGETGVGKDLFAEAIHQSSNRQNQPFIVINCSSFSKDMLESELFGYKAGAFTGAIKDKKGLLEIAHNGTVFLDELGEMNLELQAKILRVIQNRSFIKLGDTRSTTVNCRFIAATNMDLNRAVLEGRFREDLFYRINSFTINIPPLIERGSDLQLLVKYYIHTLPAQLGLPIPEVTPEFMDVMRRHRWRGNVRELVNVLQRAIILSDGPLTPSSLDYRFSQSESINHTLEKVELAHINKILKLSQGNKTEAARNLGISLSTLYRKLDLKR